MRTGKCSICGWYARLFKDHSHATGFLRGYVCVRCNNVLASIEWGKHRHECYHFVVGAFVVDVDCSRYHQYLRAPPLERLGMRYN